MKITFESKDEQQRVMQTLQKQTGAISLQTDDLRFALEKRHKLPWEFGIGLFDEEFDEEIENLEFFPFEMDEDGFVPCLEAQFAYLAGRLDACFRLQEVYPLELKEIRRITGLSIPQLYFLQAMWTQQNYCEVGRVC